MTNPFMLTGLRDVQTGMVTHWFRSLSHFFDLTNTARLQADALALYLDTLEQKQWDHLRPVT